MPEHARPGVAHNLLDSFLHVWFVAMNRTVNANRLPDSEGTVLDPLFRIGHEFIAIRA